MSIHQWFKSFTVQQFQMVNQRNNCELTLNESDSESHQKYIFWTNFKCYTLICLYFKHQLWQKKKIISSIRSSNSEKKTLNPSTVHCHFKQAKLLSKLKYVEIIENEIEQNEENNRMKYRFRKSFPSISDHYPLALGFGENL